MKTVGLAWAPYSQASSMGAPSQTHLDSLIWQNLFTGADRDT